MYISGMDKKTHEICLAHSLRRADRVVSQLYNEYFSPLGPWGEAQKMLRKKLGKGKDDVLMDLSRQIVAIKE